MTDDMTKNKSYKKRKSHKKRKSDLKKAREAAAVFSVLLPFLRRTARNDPLRAAVL